LFAGNFSSYTVNSNFMKRVTEIAVNDNNVLFNWCLAAGIDFSEGITSRCLKLMNTKKWLSMQGNSTHYAEAVMLSVQLRMLRKGRCHYSLPTLHPTCEFCRCYSSWYKSVQHKDQYKICYFYSSLQNRNHKINLTTYRKY